MDEQIQPHSDLQLTHPAHPAHFARVILYGILLFLIIISAVGGGYLLGIKSPVSRESDTQLIIPPTAAPVINPQANWKTYNYLPLSFSIKYPPTWSVSPEVIKTDFFSVGFGDANVIAAGSDTMLPLVTVTVIADTKNRVTDITDIPNIKGFEDLAGSFPTENIIWEDREVGGIPAKKTTHLNCQSGSCHLVLLKKGAQLFSFSMNQANPTYVEQFETMLDTVSFAVAPIAKKDILLSITNSGGMCPNGTCQDIRIVTRDGILLTSAKTHTLTDDYTDYLTKLVNTTNFDREKAKQFTGTCPTAYDGSETTYVFHTDSGEKTLSSCETDINYDLPIFKEIATMSKLYE